MIQSGSFKETLKYEIFLIIYLLTLMPSHMCMTSFPQLNTIVVVLL